MLATMSQRQAIRIAAVLATAALTVAVFVLPSRAATDAPVSYTHLTLPTSDLV